MTDENPPDSVPSPEHGSVQGSAAGVSPDVPSCNRPGCDCGDAQARYEAALDRVGVYLTDCENAESHNDPALICMNHPITVGDLWTLYCAHQTNGNHHA